MLWTPDRATTPSTTRTVCTPPALTPPTAFAQIVSGEAPVEEAPPLMAGRAMRSGIPSLAVLLHLSVVMFGVKLAPPHTVRTPTFRVRRWPLDAACEPRKPRLAAPLSRPVDSSPATVASARRMLVGREGDQHSSRNQRVSGGAPHGRRSPGLARPELPPATAWGCHPHDRKEHPLEADPGDPPATGLAPLLRRMGACVAYMCYH
jgi:hypothetical protein